MKKAKKGKMVRRSWDAERCVACGKFALVHSDLGVDLMLVGSGYQSCLRLKHPVCRYCMRRFGKDPPAGHLAYRGIVKRLTDKQAEAAGRALGRRLEKMQDES